VSPGSANVKSRKCSSSYELEGLHVPGSLKDGELKPNLSQAIPLNGVKIVKQQSFVALETMKDYSSTEQNSESQSLKRYEA
jgi:hypothetical protein